MIEAGEDASLAAEATLQLAAFPARTDQLDRGALAEIAVDAFAEIDRAHAAAAELALEQPRPDARADQRVARIGIRLERGDQIGRGTDDSGGARQHATVGGEHREDLRAQGRFGARRIDEGGALAGRAFERRLEHVAHAPPLPRIHRRPPPNRDAAIISGASAPQRP